MRGRVWLLLALAGCTSHTSSTQAVFHGVPLASNITCPQADCSSYNVQPAVRTRSRYGVGCMGNTPPGTVQNPELPPQSYLASDIGKAGVPKLRPQEAAIVAHIRKEGDSKFLRIAWIDGATTPNNFIVFDATDGPCEAWAGGYHVMNGTCNEFYQPGENPYRTHAAMDCFRSP